MALLVLLGTHSRSVTWERLSGGELVGACRQRTANPQIAEHGAQLYFLAHHRNIALVLDQYLHRP